MKSKKPYIPPNEISINGEKVKFHYSREERLKNSGLTHSMNNEKSSFFSKKNRAMNILLFDILLIAVIGIISYNLIGRSVQAEVNDINYFFSRKYYSRGRSVNFIIQLKNKSNQERGLTNNLLKFIIKDKKESIVYQKEVLIDKNRFVPDEDYIDNIRLNNLAKGDYTALLYVDTNKYLNLKFLIR